MLTLRAHAPFARPCSIQEFDVWHTSPTDGGRNVQTNCVRDMSASFLKLQCRSLTRQTVNSVDLHKGEGAHIQLRRCPQLPAQVRWLVGYLGREAPFEAGICATLLLITGMEVVRVDGRSLLCLVFRVPDLLFVFESP